MKKLHYFLNIVIALICASGDIHAQSYVDYSRFAGGFGVDDVTDMQVINGETYMLGNTRSANFPATNGSIYRGAVDITLTKYGVHGDVIYSTYIGGLGNDIITSMKLLNGEVYLAGTTDSINFPVTDGSVFKGSKDEFIAKISTNGTIIFATYLGGIGIETPVPGGLEITGNEIIISGTTGSPDFPVTNGTFYHGGASDVFITTINASTGLILASGLYGGSKTDYLRKTNFENGSAYLTGITFSPDINVTIGSPVNDEVENGFIVKLNANTLSTQYCRYLGGIGRDLISSSVVVNGILYITGATYSLNFPVTNGSASSNVLYDYLDGFLTKLGSDGSILYSTYLATGDLDDISNILVSNGDVFLGGRATQTSDAQKKLLLFKVNASGSIAYTKELNLGFGNPGFFSFEIYNGDLFVSGISVGPAYPVTNGSPYNSGGSGFFTHFDALGNIVFSTFLGKMTTLLPMKTANGKFYLLGNTDVVSQNVTNSSTINGLTDNVLIILKADGSNFFTGYLGGNQYETPRVMQVDMENVFFGGQTNSANYPVTNTVLYSINPEQFITKISFCPLNYLLSDDTLSPTQQSVCKTGLAEKITGVEITVPGDSLPPFYINGVQNQQQSIPASYQWQRSDFPTGPWADISLAIFKDYRPVIGAFNQYYRRQCFSLNECGNVLLHTSNVAAALVNDFTAPIVDAGGPFITCPGSPVILGGSPSANGGNPPYINYSWGTGVDSVSNPVVNPAVSTIYTLTVTDTAGCQQISQAQVLTYRADAGTDKGACGGIATEIGTGTLTGIFGIAYTWQPVIGLSNPNIAQPLAIPDLPVDYILTLSIPKTGGGICTTKDSVRVTPVAAPLNPQFAGPDKVSCLDDSVFIGAPPQAGFTYTWSPGSYLTGNTTSTIYYYPGNTLMPVPNPATIYLTAEKNGCSFSDETQVATIEARAGLDGCGARIIGLPDRTPFINETYSWTKISGSGDFTGATNLPQVPVSASVGTPTFYHLTVSYGGHSCTDDVKVDASCTGCWTLIEPIAKYLCPDFEVNNGDVTLVASTSVINAVYSWTPLEGLSNYTGNTVHLTDNIPRNYTVTVTDINDSLVECSHSIRVNDPAFSLPVFSATDTVTCSGIPVTIGVPSVEGYTYLWTGPGLSSNLVGNPVATINSQTSYTVKITDGNGCEIRDTLFVAVQDPQADAGPDLLICSNGIVTLGSDAQPDVSYLWEPQVSPWQNGTNQFSAQPDVFVAANLTFTLSATTSAGCVANDTVNISINSDPVIPDAPDEFLCINNSITIGSPALPGVVYQWTPVTGLSNPNIAQPQAFPGVSTTYTVIATFPGNCNAVATDQVTVTVDNPYFNLPDITYCPGGSGFPLGIGAPANMASYSWQPQQLVTNPSIGNPSTLTPPPNSNTLFTLSVTDLNGCTYKDTVKIIPVITPVIAGPDRLICRGQSILIGSSTNIIGPDITYSWAPTANLNEPTSPNPLFTGLTGGTFIYIITKTDNLTNCSTRDTVLVSVVDSLVPPLNPLTLCRNTCTEIGTTSVAGIQYHWTPVTGLSDPNISNPVACIDSLAITYTLTGINSNGCITSSPLVINVNSLPAPQLSIPAVTACIGDSNVQFMPSISPPGNYVYLWSPDNTTLNDIHSANPIITIATVGTTNYQLQLTDTLTGCTAAANGTLTANLCSPLSVIGDFMWYDNNSNGIQDTGEIGVSGMLVRLFNNIGFNVGTTITDPNGNYYFTDVPPGENYYLTFTKPPGFNFTIQNMGGIGASNNSKPDTLGKTGNFVVPVGSSILNLDAGIKASGAVPVTLLSFTGTLRNREVFLNWQTTAEYNNHYFSVERSANGISFNAIGRVIGNGTTVLPHNYSLIDTDPIKGMNYYRLRQVDLDDNGAYSNIVRIRFEKNDAGISAYFDNNNIQILFEKIQDNTSIKLFGANGQLIRSAITEKNITHFSLELPSLSPGIYMLQVKNNILAWGKKIFIDR